MSAYPQMAYYDDIYSKVDECLTQIELAYHCELVIPEIKLDLRGRVAGTATRHVIRINKDLLLENWDDYFAQVIPHEVAHTAAFQMYSRPKPHGTEWKRIMHVLGVPALRCHSYDAKPARVHPRPHLYACACREHRVTNLLHRKMSAGQERFCTACKGRVTYLRSE